MFFLPLIAQRWQVFSASVSLINHSTICLKSFLSEILMRLVDNVYLGLWFFCSIVLLLENWFNLLFLKLFLIIIKKYIASINLHSLSTQSKKTFSIVFFTAVNFKANSFRWKCDLIPRKKRCMCKPSRKTHNFSIDKQNYAESFKQTKKIPGSSAVAIHSTHYWVRLCSGWDIQMPSGKLE